MSCTEPNVRTKPPQNKQKGIKIKCDSMKHK